MCICLLGLLDLFLNFPAFLRWTFSDVMRNILKIVVSLAWSLILPVCYLHQNNSVDLNTIKNVLSVLNQVNGIPPLYLLAVGLYLLPNVLAAVLFMFPILLRSIENSDYLIIRLLLWWSQVLPSLFSTWVSSTLFLTLTSDKPLPSVSLCLFPTIEYDYQKVVFNI